MKTKEEKSTQNNVTKRKEEDLIKDLSAEMKKGKVKRLSFGESIYAKYCGRIDGKEGIPKLTEEGVWKSPFLEKEYFRYQQFCSDIWLKLEKELFEANIQCKCLVDDLYRLGRKLNDSKKEKSNEVDDEKSLTMRKPGEEEFRDDQVLTRRKREQRQRAAKKRAAISSIEAEFVSKYKELSYLHSLEQEAANWVRLICEREMNHSRQLAEVYWRSAYRYHSERNKMPISVRPFGISDAEKKYMDQHSENDSATIEILKHYEKKVLELENETGEQKEVA